MKVPLCDLTRLSREVAPLVEPAWRECLSNAGFVGGSHVDALESDLAKTLSVDHVTTCANGTDALELGLRELGIGEGDAVAIPNLTFWATYEAVVNVGARPVLIDVDDDLQLDFEQLKRAKEEFDISGAILVHLFGWATPRLAEIRDFCLREPINLLEDGAQSFGVEVHGVPVLAQADVGTCSFYPAKVIGGAGDGGAVTKRGPYKPMTRCLANHGRIGHYEHYHVGRNSRMDAIQAAYLRAVVMKAPEILKARREALEFYHTALDGRKGLRVHMPPTGVTGNGYLAVVTSDRHDGAELSERLTAAGIGNARTYPITIADQRAARNDMRGFGRAAQLGRLSVSRSFAQKVVNLPLFYGITPSECEQVVSALLDAA